MDFIASFIPISSKSVDSYIQCGDLCMYVITVMRTLEGTGGKLDPSFAPIDYVVLALDSGDARSFVEGMWGAGRSAFKIESKKLRCFTTPQANKIVLQQA